MVFGRQLRTGLEIQINSWENNDNAEETLKILAVDFVRELQQRVKTALEAASVNALSAHEKAKQYYDRRCTNRQLTENDLVLILEPTSEISCWRHGQDPLKLKSDWKTIII